MFVILFVVTLSACSNEERSYSNLSYLQVEQINNPIEEDEGEKLVEENNDLYVKWTAELVKIDSKKKIYLREEGLPQIEVKLENILDSDSYKKGDIITISGKLKEYKNGIFTFTPTWKIEKGLIEPPTDSELEVVNKYRKDFSVIIQTAEQEKQKEIEKSALQKAAEEDAKKFKIVSTVDYAHNSLIFHVETGAKNMEELEKVVRLIYDSEKKDIVSRDAIDIYFYPIGTLEFNSDAIFAESAMAFTKIGRAQTLLESTYTFSITISNTTEKKIFNL